MNTSNFVPKISIIVPVYNAEQYLEECLSSLINQTFKDIEIICINDGSNDNSQNIIEKYKKIDTRIILISQSNSGPASARNAGLLNSRGQYIMFCDSDDKYMPSMCEEMFAAITTECVDFVMCDAQLEIDEKCDYKRKAVADSHRMLQDGKITLLNNKNKISVTLWNKIFRNEIIKKYNILFPSGYEFDDNIFIYKYLLFCSNTFAISKKLYVYKLHEGSIMENFFQIKNEKKMYDFVFAFKNFLDFASQYDLKNNSIWITKSLEQVTNFIIELYNPKISTNFTQLLAQEIFPYFKKHGIKLSPPLKRCYKHRSTFTKTLKIKNTILFSIKNDYYNLHIDIFNKRFFTLKRFFYKKKFYLFTNKDRRI